MFSKLVAYLLPILASFVLALILTPLARAVASRYGILDFPGDRKIHIRPKPYLGGFAIYFAFLMTVFAGLGALYFFQYSSSLFSSFWILGLIPSIERALPQLFSILLGATISLSVGFWDDCAKSPRAAEVKLAVQLCAALLVVNSGVILDVFEISWLNYILTVLWIVGLINSFNMLDNMDGLSAGIAAIILAFLAIVAIALDQHLVAFISLSMVGALIGFLVYNFEPSSIFMGDAGSHFIGFMVGTLTVLESYVDGNNSPSLAICLPLLLLGVPLLDTFSVIWIRLKNNRPIYLGDKNHLSHRLVNMGLSQRQAVLLLYSVTFCTGLGAVLLPWLNTWQAFLMISQALAALAVFLAVLFFADRRRKEGNFTEFLSR